MCRHLFEVKTTIFPVQFASPAPTHRRNPIAGLPTLLVGESERERERVVLLRWRPHPLAERAGAVEGRNGYEVMAALHL